MGIRLETLGFYNGLHAMPLLQGGQRATVKHASRFFARLKPRLKTALKGITFLRMFETAFENRPQMRHVFSHVSNRL